MIEESRLSAEAIKKKRNKDKRTHEEMDRHEDAVIKAHKKRSTKLNSNIVEEWQNMIPVSSDSSDLANRRNPRKKLNEANISITSLTSALCRMGKAETNKTHYTDDMNDFVWTRVIMIEDSRLLA